MGDLVFNVEKLVDLNKVVTLDIDKNVDVTVDNPDILATSEADAEAFGPNALAEVDAFTYVNVTHGGSCTVDIDIDAVGNSTPFTFGDDSSVPFEFEGNVYDVPNTVEQNFTEQIDGLPTVAALTWTGGLANDANPPITSVTQLPADGIFEPENDKVWELEDAAEIEGAIVDGTVLVSADYNLDSWTVDLGTRDIVCEGTPYTGDLSLEITDATYLVGYLDEDADGDFDAIEVEFEAGDVVFVFEYDDQVAEYPVFYEQTAGEVIGTGLSNWTLEGLATAVFDDGPGTGEAFAYAESSAALDLA